jgi:hypothetical protein
VSDNTTNYGTDAETTTGPGQYGSLNVQSSQIVLSGTTTIRLQGRSQAGTTAGTATHNDAVGSGFCSMLAVQIA